MMCPVSVSSSFCSDVYFGNKSHYYYVYISLYSGEGRKAKEEQYDRRETEELKVRQHQRDMEKLALQRTMEKEDREAVRIVQTVRKQNLPMEPPNGAPPRLLVRSTSSTLPDMST